MKTVFANTAYWIALLNRHDWLHQRVVDIRSQLESALIVTSEMVLTEVTNGCCPHLSSTYPVA